ncbi:MAG: NTP transferase domain-containing protein [Actinomycetaceae bacterium]|nr:NTP transferase domain-containing protein [Actinomycetaceae bacterium]
MEKINALILAGGGGQRLGGVTKADLTIAGKSFLDQILLDLLALGVEDERIVVSGPAHLAQTSHLRSRVMFALEAPPAGGPAAGIVAALRALPRPQEAKFTFITACDAPYSARALPLLRQHWDEEVDATCARTEEYTNYLLGWYNTESLLAAIAQRSEHHHMSVRRLVAELRVRPVQVDSTHGYDVDTWHQYRQLKTTAPASPPAEPLPHEPPAPDAPPVQG